MSAFGARRSFLMNILFRAQTFPCFCIIYIFLPAQKIPIVSGLSSRFPLFALVA